MGLRSILQLVIRLIKAGLVLETRRNGKWRWMSLQGRGCETGMPNRARPLRLPAVEEIDSPLHPRSPQIYSHCKVTGHCGCQVALFRSVGNVCVAHVCTFSVSCLFTCTHPNCSELNSHGVMSSVRHTFLRFQLCEC